MGTVYAARDTTLQRDVALKVISPELASGSNAVRRFEQEALLAAQLSHDNIAQVYGVGNDAGSPYLVMEHITGETLQQRVERQGAVPVGEAWNYVLQAAVGLQQADTVGIIHRDIKPANLMLEDAGLVKLMDFGVSKLVNDDGEEASCERPINESLVGEGLTRAGALVGTPMYMSPEQASSKKLDARSDIYSLGMTLYFLLSGRTPFEKADTIELIVRQCTESPPRLHKATNLTRDQHRVLERMIAKNPDDRYPDYDSLIADLRDTSQHAFGLATVSRRMVAAIATILLVRLVTVPFLIISQASIFLISQANISSAVSAISSTLAVLISPVVYILGIWRYGQTPGKWLLGIRVVRQDGTPLALWQAAIRYVVLFPTSVVVWFGNTDLSARTSQFVPIVWLVSLLVMAALESNRGIHDLAAGTKVVQIPGWKLSRIWRSRRNR